MTWLAETPMAVVEACLALIPRLLQEAAGTAPPRRTSGVVPARVTATLARGLGIGVRRVPRAGGGHAGR